MYIANNCPCCDSTSLAASPAILMPFISHRVFNWKPVKIDRDWGLQTIESGTAYSICNTLTCDMCDFTFLDIRFDDSMMENLYKNYRGAEYTSLREQYEPGYSARNAALESVSSYISKTENFLKPYFNFPINILDWGGDSGKNTPFQHSENQIYVYDISDIKTEPNITKLAKYEIKKHTYDLVVCAMVLEHVPEPSQILKEIHNIMDNETILYIEIPYEQVMRDGSQLPQAKKHWHEHINFFSQESIKSLLRNENFEILKLAIEPINGALKDQYMMQLACKKDI